jgi:hypothetical protein
MHQRLPRVTARNPNQPARFTKTLLKQISAKKRVALCEAFQLPVTPTGKRGRRGVDYVVALYTYVEILCTPSLPS